MDTDRSWGLWTCGAALLSMTAVACDGAGSDSTTDAGASASSSGETGEATDTGNDEADSATEAPTDGSEPPAQAPPDGECGAITTFELGRSPTRELFVDANAAGSGDGSEAAPFATLEEAFAVLEPGTAVRVLPGTYPGGAFVSNAHGTEENPIWIGGVAGAERPLISGGSNAFQFSPASYLILHDLELSGQESNGLNVDDGEVGSEASHHLVFRNLLVHALGDGGNQDCVKLSGVSNHFVLDSEFEGCSGGSAVDHVGCHHGVIAGNTFANLTGNGVQSKGGSDDIVITRNRFLEAGERAVNMGGSTGFEFFRPALSADAVNYEARDIRVIANLFRGGISPIAFVGCVDCVAANNTLVDPEHWILRILQETTSADGFEFAAASNGRFVNNLVYYSRAALSTHVNVGPDTAPDSFEFNNNLWYAYDDPSASTPDSLPVAESGAIHGEDPNLADLSIDDIAIGASSPAAAAGLDVHEDVGDLEGSCFGHPPSIGAIEVR